ncbi:MAG TPA: GtrA family protein [Pseudonocardiaceae bacterium]|jgi:putative flippase GtrA|nr:GtrA family protein [Pseudonocardiaceae bacterium]
MASVQATPERRGVVDQAIRFVVFGVLSAGVDFGVYQLFLHVGTWADVAKAISFICGTITAYALNRRWTFDSAGGAAPAARFAALYTVTFFVNVGVNALGLYVLSGHRWTVPVAWVIAQGTATVINFVMLRLVVFRDTAPAVSDPIRFGPAED